MPRKKKDLEPEDPEPNQPRGECLPALEDFVRKLDKRFASELTLPKSSEEETDDEDDE